MAVVKRSVFARTHSHLSPAIERSSVKRGRRVTPAANHLAQQVGLFFRNLRQVFWISREQIAQKLATRADPRSRRGDKLRTAGQSN